MELDTFTVYIDRLRHGERHKVEGEFPSNLFDMDDQQLKFDKPISIKGEAYLADDELVIHTSMDAIGSMPCSICNKWTPFEIHVKNFYSVHPLIDIRSSLFDMTDIVREEILVNVPYVIECEGKCANRAEVAEFLKESDDSDVEKGYHPFADL